MFHNACCVIGCVLAFVCLILTIQIYRKVNCSSSSNSSPAAVTKSSMLRANKSNNNKNTKWSPPPSDGNTSWTAQDQASCVAAFNSYPGGYDNSCQNPGPNSDLASCADYPLFYCSNLSNPEFGNPNLGSSGNLDPSVSFCQPGSKIAYSADACASPQVSLAGKGYLCGGPNMPACACNKCGPSGTSGLRPAPADNPLGALGVCMC